MSQATGREGRSNKGAGTRRRIIAAARKVLADHGAEGFTTRRVAALADISHGQTHYHFATKRDLVIALIDDARADWVEPLERLVSSDAPPAQRMEHVIEWMAEPATVEVMRTHQSLYRFALDDEVVRRKLADEYARWRAPFARLFGEIADGAGLEGFDASSIGEAFASAADGLVQQQSLDPELPTGKLLTSLYKRLITPNGKR